MLGTEITSPSRGEFQGVIINVSSDIGKTSGSVGVSLLQDVEWPVPASFMVNLRGVCDLLLLHAVCLSLGPSSHFTSTFPDEYINYVKYREVYGHF